MKIKDRIKKKLNIISSKEDISSLKFSTDTFNELLKNVEINKHGNFIEFVCVTKNGALKFNAQKSGKYKLNLVHAFAKVFDFESDVLLTGPQLESLQFYINESVKSSVEKKTVTESFKSLFNGSTQDTRITV